MSRIARGGELPARRWSLARQLLVLQAVIVAVLVGGGVTLAYLDAADSVEDRAKEQVTAVALTIAGSPTMDRALSTPNPTALLQPFAEHVRADTGVDFITIMDPRGIRYTHPNPDMIGLHFIGNTAAALRGELLTETYTGTLGPSVRVVAPVFKDDRAGGAVAAMVSVGITVSSLSEEVANRLPPLLAVAGAVLAVGLGGSYLLSARLRRQTRGVAPAELSDMFDYHEAVLHAVLEGLLLVGKDGRIVLCNDAARELLGLTGDVRNVAVTELGLAADLCESIVAAEPHADEIHVTDTRVLLVNVAPVSRGQRVSGNVVTLRDHTQLQQLTGELDTVRGFTESLRAQAHESANRLHTVVSLVELGRPEQAVRFATAELETTQQLTDQVVGAVSEPVLAALLLGKSTETAERGVDLVIESEPAAVSAAAAFEPGELVTILGNLIDNAVDAAAAGADQRAAQVTVTVAQDGRDLVLRVADSGQGVSTTEDIFRRGWSTKQVDGPVEHGLGLALVGQAVRRRHGAIEVGRDAGAVFTVRLPLPEAPGGRA